MPTGKPERGDLMHRAGGTALRASDAACPGKIGRSRAREQSNVLEAASRPSEILSALQRQHPDATNPRLADLFVRRFPLVRTTAKRVIWRCGRSSGEVGMLQYDQLDTLLGEMLSAASYVRHPEAGLP